MGPLDTVTNLARNFDMTSKRTTLLAILLIVTCRLPAAAQDHAGINGIYQRMSAAYAALDSQAFADIYAAD